MGTVKQREYFKKAIYLKLRSLFVKLKIQYRLPIIDRISDSDEISILISRMIESKEPFMVGRYGSLELLALRNYFAVNKRHISLIDYVLGKEFNWWWDEYVMNAMENNAGFFPAKPDFLQRFGDLMINASRQLDVLGCWSEDEYYMQPYLKNVKFIKLLNLEPYWSSCPWTKYLKGKNVLIVHPFADTIIKQYEKRNLLFENRNILPEFKSLKVIKAVQSMGGYASGFSNWFEALEYMKKQIRESDFDICLLGCGAYGFPLAAYVKEIGKQAIHMGGALQILFGIMGKRWEISYEEDGKLYDYFSLQNENWTRPSELERPKNLNTVENGCYW